MTEIKTRETPNAGEKVEGLISGGMVVGTYAGTAARSETKLAHSKWPSSYPLGHLPWRNEHLCSRMFIKALFVKAKTWKQPNALRSVSEWLEREGTRELCSDRGLLHPDCGGGPSHLHWR